MDFSTHKIFLDIHSIISQASFSVKRGDTGRKICFALTEKGKPFLPTSDCYAVFTAKKPDGHIIYNETTIQDGLIYYEMTPQSTAVVGRMACEIKLYGADDKLITSPSFSVVVDDTIFNEGDEIESTNEVTALTALISQANSLIDNVETKLENGEFDGHDMTHEWEGTVLKVTSASGTSEADLRGPQGVQGIQGIQGIGVEKVEQITTSTEDEGINVVRITLTNGNSYTFEIQNGSKGGKGDKGDAFTYEDFTEEQIESLRGPQGIQGIQGETGKGLVILGYYESVSALSAAVPSPAVGDAYGIGAGAPYNIYMWDGSKWVDNGQLQGAKGDKGDAFTYENFTTEQLEDLRGPQGIQGANGVSCTHSWSGTTLSVTSASGTTSANLKGDKGDSGTNGTSVTVSNVSESSASGGTNTVTFSDGKKVNIKNGTNGTNGTPCTHSWSGTTLSVTSASGTSSANLKGDKGDKGDTGPAYTLTSADKTAIANEVLAALPTYDGSVS